MKIASMQSIPIFCVCKIESTASTNLESLKEELPNLVSIVPKQKGGHTKILGVQPRRLGSES